MKDLVRIGARRGVAWAALLLLAAGCSSGQDVKKEVSTTSFVVSDATQSSDSLEAAGGDEVGDEGTADLRGEASALQPAGEAAVQEGAKTGTAPAQAGLEGRVVIAAVGDIILHERVKETAKAQSADPSEADDSKFAGWWHVFKKVKPVLDGADAAFANLETPIAKERVKASGRPPVLNGPKESLDAMSEAGFTLLNIATNHSFDQKREGVGETAAAVKGAGLDVVGGGANREEAEAPVEREIGGLKVVFFGWTVVMNKNLNEAKSSHKPWVNSWSDEALQEIGEAREEADLVVVSVHWGSEFDMKANARQKEIARELCKAGADIVLGHGPHVLHRVVRLPPAEEGGRECLVAYSLGNFLSNQGLKYRYGWHPPNLTEAKNIPYTRDAIVLRLTVAKKDGVTAIEKVEAVPFWTENNWLDRYTLAAVPPDDVHVAPILPLLEALEEKSLKRLMLEERLAAIKEMVGDAVEYVPL